MTASTAAGSPVDAYLDEMFDKLAGTGPAGRRLLAEAEDHLLAAAAEGCARGLDPEHAEREAVARFGAADGIARQVPVPAGVLLVSLRRLAVGVVAVGGAAMVFVGLSGVVAWALSWPLIRLLIATDRFGAHPMCVRPWVPAGEVDCAAQYRDEFAPALVRDMGLGPLLALMAAGAALLVALWALRRTTALGNRAWTPSRAALGLAFAVPYGLAAPVLLLYGVMGAMQDAQHWMLDYLTTGLFSLLIATLAVRRLRRARPMGVPTAAV